MVFPNWTILSYGERGKNKTYYDTGGHKVTDKNAVTVAEYYIDEGKYVAFFSICFQPFYIDVL